MLKVKNGVVRCTGTKRENTSDLCRLLVYLLSETTISEETISELLDHAIKERNILKPNFVEAETLEPITFDNTYGGFFDPTEDENE